MVGGSIIDFFELLFSKIKMISMPCRLKCKIIFIQPRGFFSWFEMR